MQLRLVILLAACALVACGESHAASDGGGEPTDAASAPSFAGAYVTPTCAPDDGLAYEIVLWDAAVPECSADGARRSLSFYVFEGSDLFYPIEPGETVSSDTSGGGFGNGSATLCPGGTPPCQTASAWSLTFDAFEADVGASGAYSVTFAGGETLSGRFDASWCAPAPPMCG